MIQVGRRDQRPPHHQPPEPVGNVAVKRPIVAVGRLFGQQGAAAELGNRTQILGRGDLIIVPRQQ